MPSQHASTPATTTPITSADVAAGLACGEPAEGFYGHYSFVTIDAAAWPHRLFLPMATLAAAIAP